RQSRPRLCRRCPVQRSSRRIKRSRSSSSSLRSRSAASAVTILTLLLSGARYTTASSLPCATKSLAASLPHASSSKSLTSTPTFTARRR
ncbi:hypothetical protein GGH95_005468, partial [Coemansia sp. RSA 1836]